jgi:hypothetical protein
MSAASEAIWETISGRDDPEQRYRIYRLCECEACEGTGKEELENVAPEIARSARRCELCRGEGRARDLVATCATPEAIGTALVRLSAEGEFDDCPIGILDLEGERGRKWIVKPWLPSTRNISDAARLLGSQPKPKSKTKGARR